MLGNIYFSIRFDSIYATVDKKKYNFQFCLFLLFQINNI